MSFHFHNKLNTLGKKIAYLRGKTAEVSSEVRDTFKEALDILSEKQEAAQKALQALKTKGSDKGDELKSGIRQILEDLEDSYSKTITYVSRKTEEYETSFLGSELKDLEQKIVVLEENAQRQEMKDLKRFQKTLEVLRLKRERAQKKFEALEKAPADTWNELKIEMEALLEDLHSAYETARTYFPEYRMEYQEQVQKTLAAFDQTIFELLEKADKSETEIPPEINKMLEVFEQKRDTIRQRLKEFNRCTAKTWEDFKSGIDDSIEDLKTFYHQIHAYFE